MSPGDDALLAASARADGDAFGAFVARHRDAIWRYTRHLTRDERAAEDASQDAFLAAWRHAGTYAGGADARPWLFSIARHAAFRQGRRRAGEPAVFDDLSALAIEAGWGAPEADAMRAEGVARVQRTLDALEPDDREVLLLVDVEGLGNAEAAGVLGVGLAALKSRLHRARLRFVAVARSGETPAQGGSDGR